MKKAVSLLLVVGLFLTLSAAACAEAPKVQKNAVAELYSIEGNYTDSVGNVENYAFHVPQLTAKSAAAEEINAEIAERFGERVEAQLKNMGEGYSIWSWVTEWHAYWYGSQLFLLVTSEIEGGFTDYAAYGYDFGKECRVDNEMILTQLGISEEDYLDNLREKVQFMFEDMYSRISEADRAALGYDELLRKTLDWQTLEAPMYLDGFGEIITIVKIASIAGAEWYYHLATPFSCG